MADICICSDVTENHILVNISNLIEIEKVLNLHQLKNDVLCLHFQNHSLAYIKGELIGVIDKMLSKRAPMEETNKKIISNGKEIEFKRTASMVVNYRGESIEFDFKNNIDFKICLLIGLYDLIELTFNLNGIIFLYNRVEVEKHFGVSIISVLRIKYSLSKEELISELKVRMEEQNFLRIKQTLESNIVMLEKFGLLYFDKELDKYRLTGRGFIFW